MPNTLQDYAMLPLPLTPIEAEDLHDYEATIARGLSTFFEVGIALGMISRKKLYRATHRTFEEYCREKWNIDRSSAYRFMEAAETKENVSAIANIENVGQARALEGLTVDEQRLVVKKAVETAPNGKLTAKHIQDVRQAEIPLPEPEPSPVAAPVQQVNVFIPPVYTPQRCDICKRNFPMGGLTTLSDGRHTCSSCESIRQEREAKAVTSTPDPVHEERKSWTCSSCLQFHNDEYGFFYRSGRQICLSCIELSDPCAACKSAHDTCSACCAQCQHTCNSKQVCRLDVRPDDDDEPDEREPEATDTLAPGIWYICDFCGNSIQHAYATYKKGLIQATICRACASKALHELLDPSDPAVIADVHRQEQSLIDPPFGCSAYRDRMKLLEAGLRVFRVDEHTCTLKEFKLSKTNTGEGSWQKFEQFPTQAAVKRRIHELDQDQHIVFESRI